MSRVSCNRKASLWLRLLPALLMMVNCTEHPSAPAPVIVPRDTTITKTNASTLLTLDSLAVRQFIDSAVRDSILGADITNFYNARNYQYAWFNEEGPTEQAETFRNLDDPGDHGPDSAIHEADSPMLPKELQHAELRLTLRFLQYAHGTLSGKIRPRDVNWYIPERKLDLLAALDTFLSGRRKDWIPLGKGFARLKEKLSAYSDIMHAGGWDSLSLGRSVLKKGMRSPLIPPIKKRLYISGDLSTANSGNKYDVALENAVKKARESFGLPPAGAIDDALIKELNVPVQRRIEQMMINLERLKWMPAEGMDHILVNIPEYRLRVFQHDTVSLMMNVVVGRAANHTVIFSDSLKYIVFSPYWNVPAGITRNEILPGMARDKHYLARHNMEITGHRGSIPIVRQRPGHDNALGNVKFLFPNKFNIYLHDTPARDLFNERQRAFSHGCIRLQHPFSLAKLLLAHDTSWTDKKIRQAMNGTTEKWVTLQTPIPVFIVYFTCWVDQHGLLHFAKDIYGHDRQMAAHLFK